MISLQKVSGMRREAEFWRDDALYDLECAKDMLDKGRWNYVVWLARQAVEKMLKACYPALLGQPIPVGHNLLTLAGGIFDEIPERIRQHFSFLNPHYLTARYVNAALGRPSEIYDHRFAEEALQRAEEAIRWLLQKLRS